MARYEKPEDVPKERKESDEKEPEVLLVPKAVSVEEMLNILNDKLDFIISKLKD